MTDGNNATVVGGTTYNAAGQMTGGVDARTYNSMGQLTNITYYGSVNITYTYSATCHMCIRQLFLGRKGSTCSTADRRCIVW